MTDRLSRASEIAAHALAELCIEVICFAAVLVLGARLTRHPQTRHSAKR